MNIPERIPHIIGLLSRAWTAHPEWRLGQLVSNIMGPGPQDVFHLSDAGLEAGLHSILGHKIIPPAPSAEAQLPQSAPDAPPVQRGVRTEAEEELIEWSLKPQMDVWTRAQTERAASMVRWERAALAHKGEDEKA